jgi:hypothetical protein
MASTVECVDLTPNEHFVFRDENIEVVPVFLTSSLTTPPAEVDREKNHEDSETRRDIVSQMFNSGAQISIPLATARDSKEHARAAKKESDSCRAQTRSGLSSITLPTTTPNGTTMAYIVQGNKVYLDLLMVKV